jgi:hypothetical protein
MSSPSQRLLHCNSDALYTALDRTIAHSPIVARDHLVGGLVAASYRFQTGDESKPTAAT